MDSRVSITDPYVQTLSARLGNFKSGGSGEIRFCSPFIAGAKDRDTKYHMYVNVRKRTFFDFRSGTSGSLSYLFKLLGLEWEDDPTPSLASPLDQILDGLNHLTPGKWKIPRAGLPEWYQRIVPGGRVHEYLAGRGVSDDDIAFYRLGQGSGPYAGWVVIPSFDQHNRCDYWVARRTYKAKFGAKYENPTVERKYHVAFLHSALKEGGGDVILCEGVFSAIVAGRSACASLGKFVTNAQLALMLQAGVRTLRLALDGDARKEILDTARRALRMGLEVTIIPLPVEQDPADMGRAAFYDIVREKEVCIGEADLLKIKLEALL